MKNKSIEIELIKELRLGLTSESVSNYQVLVLPENFDRAPNKESLIEASEALEFSKILKANGVVCANSFDLGYDVPTLERRASDIWLGQIFVIDTLAIPFLINILTSYIHGWLSKSSKKEQEGTPKAKVHVEIKLHENGNLDKIKYDGDGNTLIRILKNIPNGDKGI